MDEPIETRDRWESSLYFESVLVRVQYYMIEFPTKKTHSPRFQQTTLEITSNFNCVGLFSRVVISKSPGTIRELFCAECISPGDLLTNIAPLWSIWILGSYKTTVVADSVFPSARRGISFNTKISKRRPNFSRPGGDQGDLVSTLCARGDRRNTGGWYNYTNRRCHVGWVSTLSDGVKVNGKWIDQWYSSQESSPRITKGGGVLI